MSITFDPNYTYIFAEPCYLGRYKTTDPQIKYELFENITKTWTSQISNIVRKKFEYDAEKIENQEELMEIFNKLFD